VAALEAADKWVADPSEDHRRAAGKAAEQVGHSTPAGCVALAAFWSGGSLPPTDVPAVAPGDHLTARGVIGALMLAAVLKEPEKAQERYRQFLAQGIELADGNNRVKGSHAQAASLKR
jgi:hypothetical protein